MEYFHFYMEIFHLKRKKAGRREYYEFLSSFLFPLKSKSALARCFSGCADLYLLFVFWFSYKACGMSQAFYGDICMLARVFAVDRPCDLGIGHCADLRAL